MARCTFALFVAVATSLPTAVAAADATPDPAAYSIYLSAQCGRVEVEAIYNLAVKREADVSANDPFSTLTDGQSLVQKSVACIARLPATCIVGPCDGSKVFLKAATLFARLDMVPVLTDRVAQLAMIDAELRDVVDLCTNDALLTPSEPYLSAVETVKSALGVASRLHAAGRNVPVEKLLPQLRTCSTRINAGVTL